MVRHGSRGGALIARSLTSPLVSPLVSALMDGRVGAVPVPDGFVLLRDEDGTLLQDADGTYLMESL